jgi:hypothetical protein
MVFTYKYTISIIYRNQYMDTKPSNPLLAHFRQPAIYFQLPSGGQFWSSGLTIPVTGDLPVYPMTARDEITLRTPDALLNGQGVVDVIQSCLPNVEDAWQMPSVDVDACLIALRIASYGNDMTFDTTCPHCQEENRYSADLGRLLGNITLPDYTKKVHYNQINIKLQPQRYFSVNATNQTNYEEQRVLNALSQPELDDAARVTEYKKHMKRLIDLNTRLLADSTEYIEIESTGAVVSDPEHIYEYYQNCDAEVCKLVRARLAELGQQGAIPAMPATCDSCSQEYHVPLTFDYANFFASGS